MPFSIDRRPDAELNIVQWRGSLSLDALNEAIREVVTAGATKFMVWDFSQATSTELVRHQIEQLVNAARAMRADAHIEGKTAIVVPTDLLFGMARQAQAYASLLGPGRTFEVFRERNAAMTWLGVPE